MNSLLQYELSLPPAQRSRDRVIEYIKMLAEKNDAIVGLTSFFEPNAFDGNDAAFANKGIYKGDGRFLPYIESSGGKINVRIEEAFYNSSKNRIL